MAEIQPQAPIAQPQAPLGQRLAIQQQFSAECYTDLITNPVRTMEQAMVMVNHLPDVADGTEVNLWVAADEDQFLDGNGSIIIDQNPDLAWGIAMGNGNVHAAVQRLMVVSCMRSSGMLDRHTPPAIVYTRDTAAQLWVTEQQTGCTVLILKWGSGVYSMVHLQPSRDDQFRSIGQFVMGIDDYVPARLGVFKSLYKNAALKHDMTSALDSTGPAGRTPAEYIMVQSMFDASRGRHTQVLGVRAGNEFEFYRQTEINGLHGELLRWSAWSSYLPYWSY